MQCRVKKVIDTTRNGVGKRKGNGLREIRGKLGVESVVRPLKQEKKKILSHEKCQRVLI